MNTLHTKRLIPMHPLSTKKTGGQSISPQPSRIIGKQVTIIELVNQLQATAIGTFVGWTISGK